MDQDKILEKIINKNNFTMLLEEQIEEKKSIQDSKINIRM